MTDPSVSLLVSRLSAVEGSKLLIADENLTPSLANLVGIDKLQVITNRFDIFQQLRQANIDVTLNDFDLVSLNGSFEAIGYRVSKEKAITHRVINQAWGSLNVGGSLVLTGAKNDGIKTYVTKAGNCFGQSGKARKSGNAYSGTLQRSENDKPDAWLDDDNYTHLRAIDSLHDLPIMSKPGLYGWNKIDQGSQLLMDTADSWREQVLDSPTSILDLGCGYGFLTVSTSRWPNISKRSATDNNVAAISTITENAKIFGIPVDATCDDCGSNLQEQFDLILCNPPFHQGFATETSLTEKFLSHSRRLLTSQGYALFVVNRFIPIEERAQAYFQRCTLLAEDNRFKVVALSL